MAAVEVALDALERGDVPAISVKTGRACSNPVGMALRTSPIAVFAPRYRVVVALEPGRVVLRRALVLVSYVLLAAALTLLFVTPALGVAGLVAYAAVLGIGDWQWIGIRESGRDGIVVLKRVHPAFVRAVAASR